MLKRMKLNFQKGINILNKGKYYFHYLKNIFGSKVDEEPSQSFDKIYELYNNFKMKNKDNGHFIEIYDFERGSQDAVSKKFYKLVIKAANQVINPSYKYLKY